MTYFPERKYREPSSWQSWTPTFGNSPNLGSGSLLSGRYRQDADNVDFQLSIQLGSTGLSFTSMIILLPVAALSSDQTTLPGGPVIATGYYYKVSTAKTYPLWGLLTYYIPATAGTVRNAISVFAMDTAALAVLGNTISSTSRPVAMGVTDQIVLGGSYRAAVTV